MSGPAGLGCTHIDSIAMECRSGCAAAGSGDGGWDERSRCFKAQVNECIQAQVNEHI